MYKKEFLQLFIALILTALLSCAQKENSDGVPSTDPTTYPVELLVNTTTKGDLIPEDFIGLSFETGSVRTNNAGVNGQFFNPNNKQSLCIFKQLGIKNLRIGGGSVDANQSVPTNADIDALFGFAKTADIKVIYSVRLLNGNVSEAVNTTKYIWDRYQDNLECFAIGNEPDWDSYHNQDPEITDYPTFLAKWKKFAAAIVVAIPEAKFTGPHTGSNYPVTGAKNTYYNGKSWTENFAADMKASGLITMISQHNYVGQDATNRNAQELIDNMLLSSWPSDLYPKLYNANLLPVVNLGYRYRLAESNSYSGQVDGASNSFATALFSLDYLHWWAEHKCAGVNFHNKQWVKNAPIFMDVLGNFQVNPVGYGIMAFNLGGHGYVQPMTTTNPKQVNLTAYAVRNNLNVYVTLINKEHGLNARDAKVTIDMLGNVASATTTALNSSNKSVTAYDASLGGASIYNDKDWQGSWNTLTPDSNGKCTINVPAGSAVIVNITLK